MNKIAEKMCNDFKLCILGPMKNPGNKTLKMKSLGNK